jgi:NADH-quinone oxidoreductase subunit L
MEIAAVFLPLAAAFIVGFFGRIIGDRGAHVVTCTAVVVAALISCVLFWQVAFLHQPRTVELFTWIDSGALEVSWALRVDTLTAIMLVVVNGVSAMVHLYSIGYMHHDRHQPRFFAYLSLFTFFMLMLVTSDNLVQMYFGWEGVGVASYLLINFWYEKPSANNAAMKAFLVNRVGDFGFALGIFAVFLIFGSVEFDTIFAAAPAQAQTTISFLWFEGHALTIACLLLFMGAMGKSAQLGLHTWLPDAMEGPTPVSALIHAATMVAAGVYMLVRVAFLIEASPVAAQTIAWIGGITALMAALMATQQNDIKRVLAYSTLSQLGYMVMAVGLFAMQHAGAHQEAVPGHPAMFHLYTHAFFKAMLFLGAGAVIHACHHEQDMWKMGGLMKHMPVTFVTFALGTASLMGVPFVTSGFWSKEAILGVAFEVKGGSPLFWIGVATAMLTAFYMTRLFVVAFLGKPRSDSAHHAVEAPVVMLLRNMPLL